MSKIYLFFIFLITVVCATTTEYLDNTTTEDLVTSDYTTEVPGTEKSKSEVPGEKHELVKNSKKHLVNSTELKPLTTDNVIKIRLNDSEEIEIKPNSISREQLIRFRKYLNRKGITIKHLEGKTDGEPAESVEEKRKVKESRQLNTIVDKLKENFPEKLSDVTAEDILPLLPRNLSTLLPIIHNLRTDRCRRHAEYFLNGLHNLTKWAVQSK